MANYVKVNINGELFEIIDYIDLNSIKSREDSNYNNLSGINLFIDFNIKINNADSEYIRDSILNRTTVLDVAVNLDFINSSELEMYIPDGVNYCSYNYSTKILSLTCVDIWYFVKQCNIDYDGLFTSNTHSNIWYSRANSRANEYFNGFYLTQYITDEFGQTNSRNVLDFFKDRVNYLINKNFNFLTYKTINIVNNDFFEGNVIEPTSELLKINYTDLFLSLKKDNGLISSQEITVDAISGRFLDYLHDKSYYELASLPDTSSVTLAQFNAKRVTQDGQEFIGDVIVTMDKDYTFSNNIDEDPAFTNALRLFNIYYYFIKIYYVNGLQIVNQTIDIRDLDLPDTISDYEYYPMNTGTGGSSIEYTGMQPRFGLKEYSNGNFSSIIWIPLIRKNNSNNFDTLVWELKRNVDYGGYKYELVHIFEEQKFLGGQTYNFTGYDIHARPTCALWDLDFNDYASISEVINKNDFTEFYAESLEYDDVYGVDGINTIDRRLYIPNLTSYTDMKAKRFIYSQDKTVKADEFFNDILNLAGLRSDLLNGDITLKEFTAVNNVNITSDTDLIINREFDFIRKNVSTLMDSINNSINIFMYPKYNDYISSYSDIQIKNRKSSIKLGDNLQFDSINFGRITSIEKVINNSSLFINLKSSLQFITRQLPLIHLRLQEPSSVNSVYNFGTDDANISTNGTIEKYQAGKIRKSYKFEANDYITIDDTALDNLLINARSAGVAFWYKGLDDTDFIGKQIFEATNRLTIVLDHNTIYIKYNTTTLITYSFNFKNSNGFNHIRINYNRELKIIYLYINNSFASSYSNLDNNILDTIEFGDWGYFEDMRIYNYSLLTSEGSGIYNNGEGTLI